jgi:hypothetical protein
MLKKISASSSKSGYRELNLQWILLFLHILCTQNRLFSSSALPQLKTGAHPEFFFGGGGGADPEAI